MKKILLLLLLFSFLQNVFLYAHDRHKTNAYKDLILCYVTKVIDGDTFHCYLPNIVTSFNQIVVRLYGIDAFETRKGKRLYKQAKKYNLSVDEAYRLGQQQKQIFKTIIETNMSFVWLRITDKDLYGRYVAIVYDSSLLNVNCLLLQQYKYINRGLRCSKEKRKKK